MIKDITIGQYLPGESFIHKLDPRVKYNIFIIYYMSYFSLITLSAYIFIVDFYFNNNIYI